MATLLAVGTPAAPISFCGATAAAGYWNGLRLQANVTSNSELKNVLVADAGNVAPALTLNADVLVNHVQVRNSDGDGVAARDFRVGSANLTVEGTAGAPIVFTGSGAVTRFPLGGSITGNGKDFAEVTFGSFVDDTVYHPLDIPYLQTIALRITNTSRVTFEAGVEYQFAPGTSFEVGWNSNVSTLFVEGTSADPVVFRG